MQCVHCRAWNEDEEPRCARCGRRLHASALRPAFDTAPIAGATAPALETLQGGRAQAHESTPASAPGSSRGDHQPWLFRDPSTGPKVVPIPTLTPRPHPAVERKSRVQSTHAATRRPSNSQQSFDLRAHAAQEHSIGREVDAVIYCDAPVAMPVHRLMAAVADASMIAIALGVFMAIFFIAGGRIVFTAANGVLFLAVTAEIGRASCRERV